jgi:hypothetical protein
LAFFVVIDMDPGTEKMMVDRSGDWLFKGRKVSVYAPRVMG